MIILPSTWPERLLYCVPIIHPNLPIVYQHILNFIRKMIYHIHKLSSGEAMTQWPYHQCLCWMINYECIAHNDAFSALLSTFMQNSAEKLASMTDVSFKQHYWVMLYCSGNKDWSVNSVTILHFVTVMCFSLYHFNIQNSVSNRIFQYSHNQLTPRVTVLLLYRISKLYSVNAPLHAAQIWTDSPMLFVVGYLDRSCTPKISGKRHC